MKIASIIRILVVVLLLGLPGLAEAQNSTMEWSTVGLQMSRAELEALLEKLEEARSSGTLESAELRRAERDVALVRQRLRDGDFQVGDRIILEVEGEEELSDTLVVRTGQNVVVPVVGEVPVRGVLRSEIEEHLSEHIGRFVRSPRVRAYSLIRISLTGEVNAPGFYSVPPDYLVTDLLMIAGGPTRTAGITKMRVERGSERIWEGEGLEAAVIEGRTLDQMNLRAGDRLVIPEERPRDWWRVAGFFIGPTISILWLVTR